MEEKRCRSPGTPEPGAVRPSVDQGLRPAPRRVGEGGERGAGQEAGAGPRGGGRRLRGTDPEGPGTAREHVSLSACRPRTRRWPHRVPTLRRPHRVPTLRRPAGKLGVRSPGQERPAGTGLGLLSSSRGVTARNDALSPSCPSLSLDSGKCRQDRERQGRTPKRGQKLDRTQAPWRRSPSTHLPKDSWWPAEKPSCPSLNPGHLWLRSSPSKRV